MGGANIWPDAFFLGGAKARLDARAAVARDALGGLGLRLPLRRRHGPWSVAERAGLGARHSWRLQTWGASFFAAG